MPPIKILVLDFARAEAAVERRSLSKQNQSLPDKPSSRKNDIRGKLSRLSFACKWTSINPI
jgi:hypothetical protein